MKTTLDMVVSHWMQPVNGLQVSPSEFYEAVVRALETRKIPDLEISRVWWKESPLVAAKREYLRICRRRMVYDICAAPFGAGSFISSWLCVVPFGLSLFHLIGIFLAAVVTMILPPVAAFAMVCFMATGLAWWFFSRLLVTTSRGRDILLGLTMLGPLLRFWAERKPTYYQLDSAGVFQSAVQGAVLSVIDELCAAGNLRPLSDLERQPVAREFLKR